jgi:DNA-binding CsgD family transcriptional regulator
MGSSEPEQRVAGLVGRDRVCAVIDRLLERAEKGESGSLVLRGEAGLGKTALLGYAASRAAGKRVLSVTGVEAESDLDFAGLHSLVRPIVGVLPQLPAPQREALGAGLGLIPAAGSDRFLVSAGVLSLLAEAAEERPLLCVVDDAQWLDAPSADALVFTARRLGAEGIVILFAVRDGERRRFDAPGLDDLVLGGLDHRSARVLLDRGTPALAPAVRERLLEDAAGNPLALLELPAGLSDVQLTGRATLPDAIPLSARLQGAFRQRVERLPSSTRAALLLAAAEGDGEPAIVLRAVAAVGLSTDSLDSAERAGLIEAGAERLSFRHPLVRSAVYEAATLAERRRAHAALAEACSAPEHADRRVWHRSVATLGTDEDIATELEACAERSQRRAGHASAATAFERAAKLSDADSSRGRRLAAAARAAYAAGQVDRAGDLVSRALPIADREAHPRLLALSAVIRGFTDSLPEAVRTLLDGIAISQDASLSLEMLLEGFGITVYLADYDRMRDLCQRASAFSPVTEADRFIMAVLAGAAAELDGDYTLAYEQLARAIDIADRLDDVRCLIWVSAGAGRAGSWGDGLPYASRAVRLARERALVPTLPYALEAQASQLLGRGRFDLAYASADEGRRLALDLGRRWIASWNIADLAAVDAVRGDEQQTRAHIAELDALSMSGARLVEARGARALGILDLGLGRPSEALDRLLFAINTVRPESNPWVVLGVPDAAEAALRAQRLDEIRIHVDRFEDWVERFPNRARRALLARSRALMEDSDAERHHAQAVELADALSPFDRARSELVYGEWLRRNRRRVDARRHLRAALETFEQLAAPPWADRARSELRASGETARKRDPSTQDQLTPQELNIAGLAAGGLTNAEIAAQLFLSPRTIDYHLRKVFAKLEIASRADLNELELESPVTN